MKHTELIKALNQLKVETGSLACLGCGHEHSCGLHGCAIIRQAAEVLEGTLNPLKCGDAVYFLLEDATDPCGWLVSGPNTVTEVGTRGFWTSGLPRDVPDGMHDFTPWEELGQTVFEAKKDADQIHNELCRLHDNYENFMKSCTCFYCEHYYHEDPDTDKCKVTGKEVYFDTPKCDLFMGQPAGSLVRTQDRIPEDKELVKQHAISPFEDDDPYIIFCQRCGSGEYLHNEDGNRNEYCGQCGQRVDWVDSEEGRQCTKP